MANKIILIPTRNQEDTQLYRMLGLLVGFQKLGDTSSSWGNFCINTTDRSNKEIAEIWLNESCSDFLEPHTHNVYINAGCSRQIEELKDLMNKGIITRETEAISMEHTGHKRQRDLIKFLHSHFGAFYFDEGSDRVISPGYDWDTRPQWLKILSLKIKTLKKELKRLREKIIKLSNSLRKRF
jgi:hypothetical protein